MAFLEYPHFFFSLQVILLLLSIHIIMKKLKSSSHIPANWPILGMLPSLVWNAPRVHDFVSDILIESGGTFLFRGPWFSSMDMLLTSDPSNIRYILSKNFPNYPRGPKFKKVFDILGDGIFNSEAELWEIHRKTTTMLLHHPNFRSQLERTVCSTVESQLLPVLEFMSGKGMEIDLQDIFQRFTLDGTCKLIFDHDPKSLSIDLPYIPIEKAFADCAKALLYRHVLPEKIWKLQCYLQIGEEKKLSKGWKAGDEFVYKCISLKQVKNEQTNFNYDESTNEDLNFVAAFTRAYKDIKMRTSGDLKKFLRDTLLNLLIAGRDTTSLGLTWFFFLLAKNPSVQHKIRQEIGTTGVQEVNKMVYLHAAICESLRLFPPLAFEQNTPCQPDILPSGHAVNQNMTIVISLYAMGRMESIWGKDCLEFKPDRWITEQGTVKHEPSYKFAVFYTGPRACLGKDMSFIQMKIVSASIIWNYNVEAAEGYQAFLNDGVLLHAKHGMKVRLTKRSEQVI